MKYILIILLTLSLQAFGTNYYVKNTGNDSNNGTSDAQAWATIAKINGRTFNAGDSIFFNAGDTWRETLEVPSAGNASSNLYFGRYGTGVNPRILGSKATTTWTDQGSNVWKTDITFTSPRSLYPNYADIVFNESGTERFGIYQSNTASLNAAYEWTWSSNYIYVYSTSDPATAYTGIEVQQRRFCISTNDNGYLHFNSIDVGYSADAGYDSNNDHTISDVDGVIIENCEIQFIGGITGQQYGFGVAMAYSNMTIRNNEFHHCGRRAISVNMEYNASPWTVENILIEDNSFHHGSHTTSLDMTVNNGGSSCSIDSVVFRRNLVYEVQAEDVNYPSVQMWYQCYTGTGTIDKVHIYSNVFKYWRENCIATESRTLKNVYIYNNTFYENNTADTYFGYSYGVFSDSDNSNLMVTVKNNIFYTTLDHETLGSGALIVLSSINTGHYFCDYNLFYRINNSVRTHLINGSSYYMNTIGSLPGSWEDNAPTPGDPVFVSAPSNLGIQVSSPAKSAGTDLDIALDKDGNAFDATNPSIGAYEYDASPPVLVTSITISAEGSATTISTAGGTLQLYTNVEPDNATDTTKTWSVINGTGSATIAQTGIITAVSDGTVTARASANDASGVYDDYEITISNQEEAPPAPAPQTYGIIRYNGKIIKYNGKIVKQ